MIAPHARPFSELVGFQPAPIAKGSLHTHATTVLAVRFDEGVLVLSDRRATAGNLVMFDLAEKVMALDDSTVIAISGSFARSVEIARYLKHSFKYYRRTTLSEMSLDGKLMEITRALAGNMAMAMEGIGVFLPIVAAFDRESGEFSVHFFDAAGARFQNGAYACAGSGSERIRGVFEFLARTKGGWSTRKLDDVLIDSLHMLDIAAELDAATGGFTKTLPIARVLDRSGVHELQPGQLEKAVQVVLAKAGTR